MKEIVEQLKRIADAEESAVSLCQKIHDRVALVEQYIMDRDGRDHSEHDEMREHDLFIKRACRLEWELVMEAKLKMKDLESKSQELLDRVKAVKDELKKGTEGDGDK